MKRFFMMSMIVSVISLAAVGCATTNNGLTEEEKIAKQMQEGIDNVKAKNYAAFSDNISDSFYASEVGDKDALLSYLKAADEMGFLDDIEIDISDVVITLEGDKGKMSGIMAEGTFGYQGLTFYGAKEKGVWKITGLDPY